MLYLNVQVLLCDPQVVLVAFAAELKSKFAASCNVRMCALRMRGHQTALCNELITGENHVIRPGPVRPAIAT